MKARYYAQGPDFCGRYRSDLYLIGYNLGIHAESRFFMLVIVEYVHSWMFKRAVHSAIKLERFTLFWKTFTCSTNRVISLTVVSLTFQAISRSSTSVLFPLQITIYTQLARPSARMSSISWLTEWWMSSPIPFGHCSHWCSIFGYYHPFHCWLPCL